MFRFLFLVFLLAPPIYAAEPALKYDAKQLRTELEAVRKKYDLPAVGAAVVRSSGVALVDVVGVRKRGSEVAATVDDRFHLGTDTKAMTALLVAVLVSQKKLAYDRTLEKALPDLAKKMHKDFRKVTIEQVLTHRAGFPPNLTGLEKISANIPTHAMRTTVARAALEQEPEFAPGAKFSYSNLGYVVIGAICERAGKADWETLMKKLVFTPLEMKSAGFGAMGVRGKIDQPVPHDAAGKPLEPGSGADNPPVFGPAGRVHCSLGDWSKFIADQLKGGRGKKALLPASAYKKLQEPLAKGLDFTPGGWLYAKQPVGVVLGKDGTNTVNYACAFFIPSKDLAILIVTNQGGKKAEDACHQLRDVVMKKLLR